MNGNVEDWHLGSEGRVNVCFGDEVYQFGSGGSIVGDGSGKKRFPLRRYFPGRQFRPTPPRSWPPTWPPPASVSGPWPIRPAIRLLSFSNRAETTMPPLPATRWCRKARPTMPKGRPPRGAHHLDQCRNLDRIRKRAPHSAWAGKIGPLPEAALTGDGYTMTLTGRDVGDNHDLRILDIEGFTDLETLSYFGSGDFSQIQDAADGTWAGAEVRTQSSAQEALEQLQRAIEKKDRIRTNLGHSPKPFGKHHHQSDHPIGKCSEGGGGHIRCGRGRNHDPIYQDQHHVPGRHLHARPKP